MKTGFKIGNRKINMGELSWKLMILIVEFFFVFAAIAANYKLMILMSVLAVLFAAMGTRRLSIMGDSFVAGFMVFMLYFTVRAMMTHSYVDLLFYWIGAAILLFSTTFSDKPDRSIMYWMKWLGVFFAVGVILQSIFTGLFMSYYYPLFGTDYRVTIRRQVVFHQMYPGWTSQTFATSVNLIIGLYSNWTIWKDKHDKREFLWMLIMLVGLALTGKRGPVLFAVMAFIICEALIATNLKEFFRRFGKYLFLIGMAAIALATYFTYRISRNRNVIVRFLEIFNNTDDVSNGRFVLWKLAISLIGENPIAGMGWGRYSEYAEKYFGNAIEAHNVYLQILAEIGIVGLIIFLIPVVISIIETVRYCRYATLKGAIGESRLLAFSLFVQLFLVMYSTTGNTIYDYNIIVLWMMAWSIYLTVKNKLKGK